MTGTAPHVSVVIPNYNYGRYLVRAIDSVLQQTYPAREIMVVDDGSTDDSLAILRRYGDRIRWLQQERQGVSKARNRGVQASQGELVAFLDADDEWLPGKLAQQVARFGAQPALGFVHCGEAVLDEAGALLQARTEGGEGWVAQDLLRYRRVVIVAPGSTLLVRRSLFDAIGGFDGRLSTFADWDFCYRAATEALVGFVPEVLVRVQAHRGSMQRNVLAMEHDMLLAYEKVFRQPSPALRPLRRPCYGRVHMLLAGSLWGAGRPMRGLGHLIQALWLAPAENWGRLLSAPWRWWSRQGAPLREASSTS